MNDLRDWLTLIPLGAIWLVFLVAYAPRCLQPYLPKRWRSRR